MKMLLAVLSMVVGVWASSVSSIGLVVAGWSVASIVGGNAEGTMWGVLLGMVVVVGTWLDGEH